ncbi:MAG: hypothetical protein ACYC6Q_10965, partial [Syntrophales bacterium]
MDTEKTLVFAPLANLLVGFCHIIEQAPVLDFNKYFVYSNLNVQNRQTQMLALGLAVETRLFPYRWRAPPFPRLNGMGAAQMERMEKDGELSQGLSCCREGAAGLPCRCGPCLPLSDQPTNDSEDRYDSFLLLVMRISLFS